MLEHAAACAVITRNYASYARVLADSYFAHYPEGRFYLTVLDGPPNPALPARVRLIDPEAACPHYWEMAVRYNPLELSCAIKPFLISTLLETVNEPSVMYFDADVLILRRLREAEQMLEGADVLLTPHILQPIEPDGKQPDELYILSGGVYNMGFCAIRKSADSLRLLRWWASRVRAGAGIDLAAGMFLDQRWADLIPALFPFAAILRDETYNLAFWNLQERPLQQSEGSFEIHGRPVAFFHFSGLDIDARAFRKTHQTRVSVIPGSPLAALISQYADLHQRHGLSDCVSLGTALDSFDNGVRFHPLLRQLYLDIDETRRRAFGNPFQTGNPECFFEWAVQPNPTAPFLRVVYDAVPELHARFPDMEQADQAAFVDWARTDGAQKLGFDPALVRDRGCGQVGA